MEFRELVNWSHQEWNTKKEKDMGKCESKVKGREREWEGPTQEKTASGAEEVKMEKK